MLGVDPESGQVLGVNQSMADVTQWQSNASALQDFWTQGLRNTRDYEKMITIGIGKPTLNAPPIIIANADIINGCSQYGLFDRDKSGITFMAISRSSFVSRAR